MSSLTEFRQDKWPARQQGRLWPRFLLFPYWPPCAAVRNAGWYFYALAAGHLIHRPGAATEGLSAHKWNRTGNGAANPKGSQYKPGAVSRVCIYRTQIDIALIACHAP